MDKAPRLAKKMVVEVFIGKNFKCLSKHKGLRECKVRKKLRTYGKGAVNVNWGINWLLINYCNSVSLRTGNVLGFLRVGNFAG